MYGTVLFCIIFYGTVLSRKLFYGTVLSSKIFYGTVLSRKIFYGTVLSRKLFYGTVLSRKIFYGTVLSRKIFYGTVLFARSYGFAKATRFSVCRGTAVGAAPLQTEKPVHFPCPARLDFAEPHVQIEEEAVSTEPCGIY